jgi:hypothetical protein
MCDTTKATVNGGEYGIMLAVGGVAAILSAFGALADVAIGMATGGGISDLPSDALGRFAELLASPALGLYHLDLLNLVTTLIMVPVLYACWLALRQSGAAASLALTLGAIGTAVFVAINPALPLLGLSWDYASADIVRRELLSAAGEALLARGAHGSPGVLPAFMLVTLANIVLSGELLRTRIFGRATGMLGLSGNLLLAVYLILVTFLPQVRPIAMAVAAPGGLLAIAWTVLTGIGLFRLSRNHTSC